MNRRDLIKGAVGFGALAALGGGAAPALADVTRAENEKAGTTDWMLTNTRVDPRTKYRCPWIEGYCSHTSLRVGETLEIKVSTNPPSPFVIDLYRMGYYGGKGARHLGTHGPFKGAAQPDPKIGEERVRECRWETALKLPIPKDWPSGVYLGKLTAEREKLQSYVIFIVRDDRACDFLFQSSVTTWSAYNRWPGQFSLYDNGKEDWYWGPNVRVSFDRPYGKYLHNGDWPLSQGSGEFFPWEFPLSFWLEKNGYDVSYISNVDTHRDAKGLRRAKGWISTGHDEYWSRAMFENVKSAVAAGLNAAFLSSNTCLGLIPFMPSWDGTPHRVISRVGIFGDVKGRPLGNHPEIARFKPCGLDEGLLLGNRTVAPVMGVANWICSNEKHWIFEGTGMKDGDSIPGLVGWEWQGNPAKIPGLEVVARGKVADRGVEGEYTATVYPGPKSNHVFSCSTIWWADGLSEPPGHKRPVSWRGKPLPVQLAGPDARVQRITSNLLNRFKG